MSEASEKLDAGVRAAERQLKAELAQASPDRLWTCANALNGEDRILLWFRSYVIQELEARAKTQADETTLEMDDDLLDKD